MNIQLTINRNIIHSGLFLVFGVGLSLTIFTSCGNSQQPKIANITDSNKTQTINHDSLVKTIFKFAEPYFNIHSIEFELEENWGGKTSMYSKYSEPVKILCSVDIINCSIDYFLDASGLIQNEKDLEEDEEDPENYGHEYSVRNVKFETLKDILRIQSSDDLIKLGKRMGIRYDY